MRVRCRGGGDMRVSAPSLPPIRHHLPTSVQRQADGPGRRAQQPVAACVRIIVGNMSVRGSEEGQGPAEERAVRQSARGLERSVCVCVCGWGGSKGERVCVGALVRSSSLESGWGLIIHRLLRQALPSVPFDQSINHSLTQPVNRRIHPPLCPSLALRWSRKSGAVPAVMRWATVRRRLT